MEQVDGSLHFVTYSAQHLNDKGIKLHNIVRIKDVSERH